MHTIRKLWTSKIARLRMITALLLLSILPILGFGTVFYILGTNIVKTETNRSSITIMTQMSRQMDDTIGRIEQFTTQLAMQTSLIDLTKIKDTPALGTLAASNSLQQDLVAYVGSVQGVDSAEFYHFNQDLIVSTRGLFSLGNGSYKDFSWKPAVEQAVNKKEPSFWIAPRTAVSLEKQSYPVITYVHLLPLLTGDPKAALLVNLRLDYLRSLIGTMPPRTNGAILVFNEQRQLIVQQGNMPIGDNVLSQLADVIGDKSVAGNSEWDETTYELFKPGMFVTFKQSANSKWVYAMLIPVHSVSQTTLLLKRLILICTAVLSLLALITAYFSFSTFQRGIQRLLRLFEPETGGGGRIAVLQQHDYSGHVQYIADNIAHLMDEVIEVRASWTEQLPLLRAHYLISAILGNSSSLERLAGRYKQEFDLFGEPFFAVHIVEMDAGGSNASFTSEDLPLFLFAAANIMNELFEDKCRVETVVTRDHVIVIFNLPAQADESFLQAAAEQAKEAIKNYTRHTVTIGTGGRVGRFRELSASYHEALRALRLNWMKVGDTVLAGGAADDLTNKLALYPVHAEEELLQLIRNGDMDAIPSSLERFTFEITKHSLAFQMTKTYYLQLLAAMIRLAQEYEAEVGLVFGGANPYDAFFRLDDQGRLNAWLEREIAHPIIQLIHSSRKQRKEEVVSKTYRIVEEHYADNLSLQMLAEALNMNASYVSLIFKEESGDTFINYVTKYRVGKAKLLLLSTELTIAQIAREVGYANAQHLIRVFKKLEGITPGEYRICLLKTT